MNPNTVKNLIAAGAVVAVLLAIYHFGFNLPAIKKEAEQTVREASSDIEHRQAERSRREIAEAASDIIDRKIKAANEQTLAKAVRSQTLSDGILSISGLRTNAAEFLADHGRMPEHLGELGWRGGVPSNALSSLEMRPGGSLILHFNPAKLRGTVVLTPEIDPNNMMITGWFCTSPDISYIAEVLPECIYLN